MARIRQFKPSFFTDDKVGRLSRDARLFFFGVLSEADDEGRLVDSPKRLAGVVFPFDDDVTPKKVERWIDELEAQQMVVRYTHEGGRFLYVRKFKDHQRMSHPTPSSLPPPPPGSGQSSGGIPEKLRSDAGEPPEDFVPEGLLEGVRVFEGVSTDEHSSSSNHQSVGHGSEEEENACRQVAQRRLRRRMADRGQPEVKNPDAWLMKATINAREQAQGLDLRGLTVEEIVDLLDPSAPDPPSPYPDWRPPEQTEPAELSPHALAEARRALVPKERAG